MLDSRVERWLGRGCGPFAHSFIPIPARGTAVVVVCINCQREEQPQGGTCLICDAPSELSVEVAPPGNSLKAGRVCSECFEEFRKTGEIAGWRLQRVSHRQSAG